MGSLLGDFAMCRECGCGDEHAHGPGAEHTHVHGGVAHTHRHVELETRILGRNDEVAAANCEWLRRHAVVALNLMSSPGAGKTLLLERTLERLRDRIPAAVITGDLQTDNDARRLQGKGAAVRQIETINACHLSAAQIGALLPEVAHAGERLLFIENVGNLVCPAAFDLGEQVRVALLSTVEGEDKPEKYPVLFAAASLVLVTKMDLAEVAQWDEVRCRRAIRKVNPGATILQVSAKTGAGMDAWIAYLEDLVAGPGA
jgi:hydrogenase nickel incorporation protein HypB